MTLSLSAPSKTFLAGEYAVLAGGSGLVLNTFPRFELQVRRGEGHITGIPQGSPAWRWVEQRRPLLDAFDVEFKDPHAGAGGLGASGAQFLLLHTLTTFLQSSFERTLHGPDLKDVWSDHNVLSGGAGSGADLLSQAVGGVARVEMAALSAVRGPWPYPDVAWTIVRTHQKVPTHEHLRALDRAALSLLSRPAAQCVQAFGQAPSEVFLGHLKEFAQRLREEGLQAPAAHSIVKLLEHEDWCLMAKGCGALGADTVLFFYPSVDREKVSAFLRKTSLPIIATQADLCGGLEMKWE